VDKEKLPQSANCKCISTNSNNDITLQGKTFLGLLFYLCGLANTFRSFVCFCEDKTKTDLSPHPEFGMGALEWVKGCAYHRDTRCAE